MNWFRHYVGADFDPKFRTVARISGESIERVTFIWWALCSRQSEKGTLDGFDPEVIADHLGCDVTSVTSVTRAFFDKKLMMKNGLTSWQERQYQSPSAERTRRWRERKQRHSDGHGAVTETRDAPQNRTDSESERKNAPAKRTPDGVDQPDLDALLYQRGKALLGRGAGGQITKLRGALGSVGAALQALDDAAHKDSPAEYVAGVIRSKGNGQHGYAGRTTRRTSVVEAGRAVIERANRLDQERADRERLSALEDGNQNP